MAIQSTDLITGFDATSSSSISGALLTQMVNAATLNVDRGLIIETTDNSDGSPNTPNPSTNSAWKRYIWLRNAYGSTGVVPYIWVDGVVNTGSTLQWQSIAQSSIGSNTITSSMIQANAVSSDKVLSLDAAKLTGTIASSVVSNTGVVYSSSTISGGDLVNSSGSPSTYASPQIAPLAVTTGKIASGTILASNLATAISGNASSGGVDSSRVRGSSTNLQLLTSNGDYTCAWATPKAVTTLADPVDASKDGYAVVINSGVAKTFTYAAFPNVVKYVAFTSNAMATVGLSQAVPSGTQSKYLDSSTTPTYLGSNRPTGWNTALYYPYDISYTPKVTTSTIIVKGVFNLSLSTSNGTGNYPVAIALWYIGYTLIGVCSGVINYSGVGVSSVVPFEFKIANTTGTTLNLQFNLYSNANNVGIGINCFYISTPARVKGMYVTDSNTTANIDANTVLSSNSGTNGNIATNMSSGYEIIEYV